MSFTIQHKMTVKLQFSEMYNGLHWVYTNGRGDTLSIICHDGSYGFENGLFETQCSWLPDVQGRLTFGQVQRKIETLKKRDTQPKKVNSIKEAIEDSNGD